MNVNAERARYRRLQVLSGKSPEDFRYSVMQLAHELVDGEDMPEGEAWVKLVQRAAEEVSEHA